MSSGQCGRCVRGWGCFSATAVNGRVASLYICRTSDFVAAASADCTPRKTSGHRDSHRNADAAENEQGEGRRGLEGETHPPSRHGAKHEPCSLGPQHLVGCDALHPEADAALGILILRVEADAISCVTMMNPWAKACATR
jgi:hypothetical protein